MTNDGFLITSTTAIVVFCLTVSIVEYCKYLNSKKIIEKNESDVINALRNEIEIQKKLVGLHKKIADATKERTEYTIIEPKNEDNINYLGDICEVARNNSFRWLVWKTKQELYGKIVEARGLSDEDYITGNLADMVKGIQHLEAGIQRAVDDYAIVTEGGDIEAEVGLDG